jgi:flagellar hook assembly protein FlgD
MSVSGITNVNQNSSYSAVQNSKVGSDKLDMKDFLLLHAAPLSNQDMNEPVESTEFISQWRSFQPLPQHRRSAAGSKFLCSLIHRQKH